jgi:predicted phage-related endonuclease
LQVADEVPKRKSLNFQHQLWIAASSQSSFFAVEIVCLEKLSDMRAGAADDLFVAF